MKNEYEVNIGIEVHVQLKTKSKIFCSSPNTVTTEPNSHICPICTGYPGVLPVLNEEVLNCAIMAGIATHCTINHNTEFARKHYFYPDLPKNYQISQHDKPICTDGYITIPLSDGNTKDIRLIRIHMEEDAGKNLHAAQSEESFVDLNRAGTPLLEIVSHPNIASADEAKAYLKALRTIIIYLDIGTGNMEEGALRADTNISVRRKGVEKLGTRCELKNINSFKFIGDAIEYEVARQIEIVENGGKVLQETRSWDTKEHKTILLRSKEESADYRYFQDPDLPLIRLDAAKIENIKQHMPELPDAKFARLIKAYSINAYEAEILINDPELAHYFEAAAQLSTSKHLINWLLRDVIKLIKDSKIALVDCKVTPAHLAELINLLEKGTINSRTAQDVFAEVAQTGIAPSVIVKQKGLEQVGSADELEAVVVEIVKANPAQAAEYKAGRDRLFGFFVGQVMAKTKGKGNPQMINDLLKKHLSA